MLSAAHIVMIASALVSSCFWLLGAASGFKRLSLFRVVGPDSIPEVMQRQSIFNAVAALFAAIATTCQAAGMLLVQIR